MPSDPFRPAATPGANMVYLIKRRATTSRDELVAHWYANHMSPVIAAQKELAVVGLPYARRYIVTLFNTEMRGNSRWDGMAQLWWDQPLPMPAEPSGTHPKDTFQQKVEPYLPWATTEYVVVDGSERLPVEPLSLNAPFPSTRSGFFKVTFLVTARPGVDYEKFFDFWLDTHVPNVAATLKAVGGFRYVVSHCMNPGHGPYAGMAELYFTNPAGWQRYQESIQEDGMGEFVNRAAMPVLSGDTEMIGLPGPAA